MLAFPEHQIIAMPALSPTMTQGAIGTWQKQPGDQISQGDVLVEIETDKAQMDFECQEEGYLAKILIDSGEKDVPVGQVNRSYPLTISQHCSILISLLSPLFYALFYAL
jgi:hypothetical protein